jgi:hypothetical protein
MSFSNENFKIIQISSSSIIFLSISSPSVSLNCEEICFQNFVVPMKIRFTLEMEEKNTFNQQQHEFTELME